MTCLYSHVISSNTGEEFIKPWDVPDNAKEDGGDDINDAGETGNPVNESDYNIRKFK